MLTLAAGAIKRRVSRASSYVMEHLVKAVVDVVKTSFSGSAYMGPKETNSSFFLVCNGAPREGCSATGHCPQLMLSK